MRLSFSVVAIAVATGCGPLGVGGDPPPGVVGELGEGRFVYGCEGPSDPACDNGVGHGAFGGPIALGARFSARFDAMTGGSARVGSASEELLAPVDALGSTFAAVAPGFVALVARRGSTIVDLLHVRIEAVQTLQFVQPAVDVEPSPIDELSVDAGSAIEVRAIPVDAASKVLAGAAACLWAADDETTVAITSNPSDDRVTVTGVAEGETRLHVKLGGAEADLPVVVHAASGAGGGGTGGGGGTTSEGGGS